MIVVDSSVWIDHFNGMRIATFCIERGHLLLHSDRDFDPIAEHLGLEIV